MDHREPEKRKESDVEEPQPIEPMNPWSTILTKPRTTMRYVLDSGEWNNVWLVYAIMFFISLPSIIMKIESRELLPPADSIANYYGQLTGTLFAIIIFGYPIAMLCLYILGVLYKVVGGLLGGEGNAHDMRVAILWGYMPKIYMDIFSAVVILLCMYFFSESKGLGVFLIFLAYSTPMVIAWFYYMAVCLGEAHGFSGWKGLATIFITWFTFFALIFGFVLFLAILGAA